MPDRILPHLRFFCTRHSRYLARFPGYCPRF